MVFLIAGSQCPEPIMKSLTKSPASLSCHIRPPFTDITNHSVDLYGEHLKNVSYSHMDGKSYIHGNNQEESNNEAQISMEDSENEVQESDRELNRTQTYDEETVELRQEILRETHGCELYLLSSEQN